MGVGKKIFEAGMVKNVLFSDSVVLFWAITVILVVYSIWE